MSFAELYTQGSIEIIPDITQLINVYLINPCNQLDLYFNVPEIKLTFSDLLLVKFTCTLICVSHNYNVLL